MKTKLFIKNTNQVINLAVKPFAAGGEGELYDLLQSEEDMPLVAKLFYPHKRTAEKAAKIDYLISNPPAISFGKGQNPVAWPQKSLVDEQGNFVGFLMPKVAGEKLEILCAAKLPKYLGSAWQKLKLGKEEAVRLRLKVCYNIAVAVNMLHQTDTYVLVDLKPDNILIQNSGLVSLVDMDSIEVIEDQKTIFAATVATPEYTPAEYYHGVKPGQKKINTSWDNFSMAVIFYRLLYGIHPYAATSKGRYQNMTDLGDKIKAGLFVHNPNSADVLAVVPPPHLAYRQSYFKLKIIFEKAFLATANNPQTRPTARDWIRVLTFHPYISNGRKLPSQLLDSSIINSEEWNQLIVQNILRNEGEESRPHLPNTKALQAVVKAGFLKSWTAKILDAWFFDVQNEINKLREKQYSLYSERSILRKQKKKLDNEFLLLKLVETKREKKFLEKNKTEIERAKKEITKRLEPYVLHIKTKDIQAKKWIEEEALLLQKTELNYWQKIKNNPSLEAIKGGTIGQKIKTLNNQKNKSDIKNIASLMEQLLTLEKSYQQALEAVRIDFDRKHQKMALEIKKDYAEIEKKLQAAVFLIRNQISTEAKIFVQNNKKIKQKLRLKIADIQLVNEKTVRIEEEIKRIKEELFLLKKQK